MAIYSNDENVKLCSDKHKSVIRKSFLSFSNDRFGIIQQCVYGENIIDTFYRMTENECA